MAVHIFTTFFLNQEIFVLQVREKALTKLKEPNPFLRKEIKNGPQRIIIAGIVLLLYIPFFLSINLLFKVFLLLSGIW